MENYFGYSLSNFVSPLRAKRLSMSHRGEVVSQAVTKSGMKLSKLHTALGISRPTLYRRFEDPNLDFEFIKRVGEVIYHDFSAEFKELAPPVVSILDTGITPPFQLENLDDCKSQLLRVYSLYTDLLQRHQALLQSQPNV